MKKMLLGAVAVVILLGAGYLYMGGQAKEPMSGRSAATFTCGDFTFTYPASWYAWKDDSNSNYAYTCTAATFPQSAFEEKVQGIANLTKSEQDAFMDFHITPGITQSLSDYIDSVYCTEGTGCMGQYMGSKTAIPFDSGEAFKVVESGGENPATTPYFYKKGSMVLEVRFDMKNTFRKDEIISIAESVK